MHAIESYICIESGGDYDPAGDHIMEETMRVDNLRWISSWLKLEIHGASLQGTSGHGAQLALQLTASANIIKK